MSKKLSFFEKLVYATNIIFALLLLLSYALPYIFPKQFPILSVFSLLLPVLLLINIFFCLLWLFKLKKQLFLSLIILAIGAQHFTKFIRIIDPKKETQADDIKLMSYNVRLFNQYNWHEDPRLDKKIIDFIYDENPDIVAIQEYYNNVAYELKKYPYKSIIYKNSNDNIGQAIFSKFKIINSGSLNFQNTGNNGVFSDIVIQKDTVRLYNLHFESLHISPEKEEISQENSKRIVKTIGKSFITQQEQLALFLKHKNESPYKIIVCGDFNNTAFSYLYKSIKGNSLNDSFEEAGFGFGRTYNFNYFPFRIRTTVASRESC